MNIKNLRDILQATKSTSVTELIDSPEALAEIEKFAAERGYVLKDSPDLAGFKTVFTYADVVNANKYGLSEAGLVKALPTITGKPIDIDHLKRYVIGHYLGYKYVPEKKQAITYGVIYKHHFRSEWEQAKRLFAQGKLTTSQEVWTPKAGTGRKVHGGEIYDVMQFAGGALVYYEKAAYKGTDVLAMAMKYYDEENPDNLELAYATEDITHADTVVPTVVCGHCKEEIIVTGAPIVDGMLQCPKCKSLLDSAGAEQYPPQELECEISCPDCGAQSWLVKRNDAKEVQLQCRNSKCRSEFVATYATVVKNPLGAKLNLLVSGRTQCPQCGESHDYFVSNKTDTVTINCAKCGLTSERKRNARERAKHLSFIKKVDLGTMQIASVLSTEELNKLDDSEFALVYKVKNSKTGKVRTVRGYPINDEAHVRAALSRIAQDKPKRTLAKLGVSIDSVLSKIYRKAREFKMVDLLETNKDELKRLNVSVRQEGGMKAKAREFLKARFAALKLQIASAKSEAEKLVGDKAQELETLKVATAAQLAEKDAALLQVKSEADAKVELYRKEAAKLHERRADLGDEWLKAHPMTDADLLDDKAFKIATLEKQLASVQVTQLATATAQVVDEAKKGGAEESEDAKLRKEIDRRAGLSK